MASVIGLFLSAMLTAHSQLMTSAAAPPALQTAGPQSLGNRLLIVSARKIAGHARMLDIKLRSGDRIDVPAEDANDRATQIVRAALHSQSPRLHLTNPDHVVVLNVASLTDADDRGRLTVTLLSGATIHCRADDVRPDPQLAFLRTVLTEAISREAASRAAPPPAPPPPPPTDPPQTATPSQFGPSFQFEAKGVDFGLWLRRFRTQVYHNWLIPSAAMALHGHTVLRFTIHRDGAITDLTVLQPSEVEVFTKAAFSALQASNPTIPLPQEYPDESMVMTVVFYYNEQPPKSSAARRTGLPSRWRTAGDDVVPV